MSGAGGEATYRADIDGLRAIAVVAVILFHARESLLAGGFAGVDVFFVISGFLITGNIMRGRASGSFSFKEFYRRRVLRILPLLGVVTFSTLIAAWAFMLPVDVIDTAKAATASMLSVANIFFYLSLDTSYFASETSTKPLLHIWSLGVEEQFYLIWPAMLIVLLRVPLWARLVAITALVTASFAFAEFMLPRDAMFAYYMLPTRAGQLLIGALIAVTVAHWGRSVAVSSRQGGAWTVIGLAMVFGSLWFVSAAKPYPGLAALPVTLGTALVIFAGSVAPNGVSRLLGARPMVHLGLLSYSLYLWHWPVFAFYKYFYAETTLVSGVVCVAVVYALSWLTYHYVEQGFRRSRAPLWKATGYAFVLPSALVALLAGYLVSTQQGQAEVLRQRTAASAPQSALQIKYACQRRTIAQSDLSHPACVVNARYEPNVLLWGDSNAAHFAPMLAQISAHYGVGFRSLAHSACPPFMNKAASHAGAGYQESCAVSVDRVKSVLPRYSVVVMGGSWTTYLHTSNPDGQTLLDETVAELTGSGKTVLLMEQIPINPAIDRDCEEKARRMPLLDCRALAARADNGVEPHNQVLREIAERYEGAQFVPIRDRFCDGDACSTTLGAANAYYDAYHLSVQGSRRLGDEIAADLTALQRFDALRGLPRDASVGPEAVADYLDTRGY